MNETNDRKRFLDDAANVSALLRGFALVALFSLVLDFVIHRHVVDPWERLWGFYAIYGFVGVTALVFGAKLLRRLVMRDEDYYDVD